MKYDVTIKRTKWGYSAYVTADMTDDPCEALIASDDDVDRLIASIERVGGAWVVEFYPNLAKRGDDLI